MQPEQREQPVGPTDLFVYLLEAGEAGRDRAGPAAVPGGGEPVPVRPLALRKGPVALRSFNRARLGGVNEGGGESC